MEFANKIKMLRTVMNISQENLARELGVSFATINRLENGKTFPSYRTQKNFSNFCEKYKKILGVHYEELRKWI